MGVCQYYLKGTCKFGAACRNEHPQGERLSGRNDRYHFTADPQPLKPSAFSSGFGLSSNSNGGLFSSLSNSSGHFGNQDAAKANPVQDMKSLLQMVRKDMEEWEKGKMWPLSCFAVLKETKCLAGLSDFSPEELRWEAYKAKKNQSLQQYLDGIHSITTQSLNRRNQLKSMGNEQLMLEIQASLGTQLSSGTVPPTVPPGVLGQFGSKQPTAGLFGSVGGSAFSGSSQGAGLFGKPEAPGANPFASSGSVASLGLSSASHFGSSTGVGGSGAGLFGSSSFGTSGPPSGPGLFSSQRPGGNFSGGSAFASTTFLANPTTASVGSSASSSSVGMDPSMSVSMDDEGGMSLSSSSKGLLGNPVQKPAASLFGMNTSGATNMPARIPGAQTGGLFSETVSQPGGLFAQRPPSSIFAPGATSSGPFGLAQQSANTGQRAVAAPSANPFLTTQQKEKLQAEQTAMQSLQEQTVVAPVLHPKSMTPELTEKDMAAFKAARFVLGQIPECPPPPEVC